LYRDIPFSNFVNPDADGKRHKLKANSIDPKDFLFNRNRSLAEEQKFIDE